MNKRLSVNSSNKKYQVIIQLVQFVFSKWILISCIVSLAAILGIASEWLKTPKYTAEITFTSENDKAGGLGAYSSLASQFGIDLGSGSSSAFQGDNLIELLKTRRIVEKTLLSEYKGKLIIDAYISNHQLTKKWVGIAGFDQVKFETKPSQPNRLRDSLQTLIFEDIVKKQLVVEKPDKKLSFIAISMTDINEQFAADFAYLIAKNAISFYTEYRIKKARENFEVLQHQTDSVKALLYGNIENYAETNDLNVNPLKQKAKVGSQKIQVSTSVNTALYTELLKQLGLAKVTLEKETPLIQIIDEPVLPLKTNKKSRLMTGLLFGFIGGVITVFVLILSKFLKTVTSRMEEVA